MKEYWRVMNAAAPPLYSFAHNVHFVYTSPGQFETTSFEKFTIVELPYLGNTVSMFVVRPTDKNTPLSSIEASLTSKSIALWTSTMKKFKMDIFMPR